MKTDRSFSRRAFILVFGFTAALFGLATSLFYHRLAAIAATAIDLEAAAGGTDLAPLVDHLKSAIQVFNTFTLPVMGAGFLAGAVLLWLLLRTLSPRPSAQADRTAASTGRPASKEPVSAPSAKGGRSMEKRLFLHLLGAFQRRGRLVDFLFEDLDAFADEQIGAAVRSIHANCKNTLSKYVKLKPVIEDAEGREITLDAGYNTGCIHVVGNVSGQPPFNGVVRHRGWRAVSIELPTLSGDYESGLVAPAEVEIL